MQRHWRSLDDGRDITEVERSAEHGGGPQQLEPRGRQPADAAQHCLAQRRREALEAGLRDTLIHGDHMLGAQGLHQLDDQEGIPPRPVDEVLKTLAWWRPEDPGDERDDITRGERPERGRPAAMTEDHVDDPVRQLRCRPVNDDDRQRQVARPPGQRRQGPERRLVGPLRVVEGE